MKRSALNMKRSALKKVLLFLIVAVFSSAFFLYKAEPDFLDRVYDRFYSDRLEAAPEVMLNETSVFYDLTEEGWSIQKNDGHWYTPVKEPDAAGLSDGEQKPAAAVTSYEDKLTANVDKAPDRASLRIIETDSGQVVMDEQADLPGLPLPERNGSFTYELTMEWTGEANPYRGKYVFEIPVKVDLPEKFVFSTQQLRRDSCWRSPFTMPTSRRTLYLSNPSMINSDGIRRRVFSEVICPQITM